MTRCLQTCTRCGGRTRHADQRCAACRRSGGSGLLFGGQTRVTILRDPPRDLRAPTVAELNAGFDISARITRVELVNGPAAELQRMRWARDVQDIELTEAIDFSGRGA